MGKKSLIKSTTKKKNEDGKASPTTSKKVSTTIVAGTIQQAPAVDDPAPTSPVQPIDPKELLFRQFPSAEWPKVTVQRLSTADITAPAFVAADDPREVERMREMLLNRRHTMQEIREVAEPPAPPFAGIQPVEMAIEGQTLPMQTSKSLPLTEGIAAAADTELEAPEPALPSPAEAPQAVAAETPSDKDTTTTPFAATRPGTPPPPAYEPPDPVLRYAKFGALGFALLVIVLLGASYVNSTTCYLQPNNGASDLWLGRFSPTGKVFVTTLKGFRAPEPSRTQYRRNELFPAIFTHYLTIADQMATAAETPDFKAIHACLSSAREYAANEEMLSAVELRLGSLNLMSLLYKADVAISAGSQESLDSAARLLTEAQKMAANQPQLEMIKFKQDKVSTLAAELQARQVSGQQPQATDKPAQEAQTK